MFGQRKPQGYKYDVSLKRGIQIKCIPVQCTYLVSTYTYVCVLFSRLILIAILTYMYVRMYLYLTIVSSQSHYSVLVRSMPDNYKSTVNKLERHLTGDNIGSILECEDVFTANQRILDCLIEQVNTKEGLLDFCNWLSVIAELITPLNKLKKGFNFIMVNQVRNMKYFFITDVIAAIEVNESNSSFGNNFNVKTFVHSERLPDVVAISSACELSDMQINANLSQFGPKGN